MFVSSGGYLERFEVLTRDNSVHDANELRLFDVVFLLLVGGLARVLPGRRLNLERSLVQTILIKHLVCW